jgi:multiple sugar transport system substrate-binding protein
MSGRTGLAAGSAGEAATPGVSARRSTHRVSRKTFLRVAGMAGLAALAGCRPVPPSAARERTNVQQMVYQDWRTDWFSAMAQQMLEEFHAKHPNIHVFFTQDPPNLDDKMLADFQAGTAPDVFAGCCDFFPVWAQRGYLMDLRPYVQADLDSSTIADWDQAQYRSLFLRNGMQFALPKYHGALGLYYNRDLFDRFSVPYPTGDWTYDDYQSAMGRFVRGSSRPGERPVWGSMVDITWERLQIHANAWGGHFVDPNDARISAMGGEQTMAAMEWIRDRMWGDHTMASRLDVHNLETRHAFIQGKLAMVEDGSWALKDILQSAEFRVGVASFPRGPSRKVTLATTDGFGVYAGTRHPDAAWELMKFLVSRDYGRAMARKHLLQPARASLVNEWVEFVRNEYPGKTRELAIEAFAEGHLKGYSVTGEVFANMSEARRLARAAWEQVFTLGRAPVASLRDLSAQIQQAQA